MHRKKVEKLVSESWHGAFLIRKSSSSDSFVLCVNDLGLVSDILSSLQIRLACGLL
jgi:hypothetical protein